jgi:hypothetical protein
MTLESTDLRWNKLAQTLLDGENHDDYNEQDAAGFRILDSQEDPTCVRIHSPFLLEERAKMLKQLGKFIKDRDFDIGADDVGPLVQMSAPLTGSQAVHAVLGAQLLVDFEPSSEHEQSELKEVLTPSFVDNVFKENEEDSVQDLINRLPIETADATEAYLHKIIEGSTYPSIFQRRRRVEFQTKH